jgi:pilus assembly protein FimV
MKTAVRRVLLMSALMSPSALYALGLGEIKLNSALNQPFDAEIELVSAAQEDLSALRASLASNDTFVRYGLDRPTYLSEFTFQVVRSEGRDVLKVTSARPVTEPFVTLLVEANWPRGRLLREYTVLLDPPVFAPAPVAAEPAVATPRAATAPRSAQPRTEPASAPAPASEPSEPRAARPTTAVAAEPGATYRVQPNDTLWEIASAAYPGGRSDVNRAMVAIYQSNPAAFGGNINVLRAGSELRMPASGDVSAISASAAADEVARQYQAWKAGAAAPTESATDAGRLRLVTPEQGSAAASTTTESTPSAASTAGLQDRVKQLEAELAEARRLLEVRNAELATLQGAAVPPEQPATAEGAAPAEGAVPGAGAEAPPAAIEAQPEPEPVAQPEPEKPEAKQAKAPRAETGPSLVDRLLEYWWLLAGLLVAGLGVAAFLRGRRASSTAEEDLEAALGRRTDDRRARAMPPTPPREAPILVEERGKAEPTVAPRFGEPARKPGTVEDTISGEGPVSAESGDPLAEADFHMAYGLYDQAADLIQVASRREPERRDLKLKLLEIFFVWGNRDRFLELAREMSASRADAPAGEWDKVLIMGRQLAPEDPLFAGPVRSTSDSLDMELQAGDHTLDLKLPSFGDATATNLDINLREPRAAGAEGGLDFVLDEPVRGAGVDESLPPTVESPRLKAASSDDQTAEVPIEELGLDVGELEGLGELADLETELLRKVEADAGDTVERPVVARDEGGEEDLLSSTSIMGGDTLAGVVGEPEPGIVDLSGATSELPTLESGKIELTGYMKQPDFPAEAEAPTMSEVGTKLDLARAYIDMGDPEGARSILEEVLKEGSASQRQQAEKLLAGLP